MAWVTCYSGPRGAGASEEDGATGSSAPARLIVSMARGRRARGDGVAEARDLDSLRAEREAREEDRAHVHDSSRSSRLAFRAESKYVGERFFGNFLARRPAR